VKIAVIPARGASRRIPRKNVAAFCGKPMMAWSIATADGSGLFDRVIVSTDDDEIADCARACGAEVPFRRPAALADDHTGTTAVMAHATRWALGEGWPLEAVCCIYATAPFLEAADLRRGLDCLTSGDWSYAFAAAEYPAPIFRAFRAAEGGGVEMFFPEHFTTRSQDLPRALYDAGQFYWGRPSAWIEERRIFDRASVPVLIPRWRVHDIDDREDWVRAELMFERLVQHRS
jgi:N-acylneuraminate cytidylyltransferase